MTTLCLSIPLMINTLSEFGTGVGVRIAIGAAILATGVLDGATFPLLLTTARRLRHKQPGSFLYAADLSGACLGAGVAGGHRPFRPGPGNVELERNAPIGAAPSHGARLAPHQLDEPGAGRTAG